MTQVTRILNALKPGDPTAAEQLLPLVYEELRKLAAQRLSQERPGQTLQATALVHEAYLRLVGNERRGSSPPDDAQVAQVAQWNSRGHFFAAAAEAMRRILVNRARDKKREKRGGGWKRLELDRLTIADDASNDELIAIDEALEGLARENQACAELVKLRFFAGLKQGEAAAALGLARRTADRYWAFARAWLFAALSQEDDKVNG